MVQKNDLDRLCRLSSNEFKPATDKIVKYREPRMRLKIIASVTRDTVLILSGKFQASWSQARNAP